MKKQNINDKLLTAAQAGSVKEVRKLLASGADVNAKDWAGMTPLMYAVKGDHVEVVEALLAAEANVNVKSKLGWTAAMYAKKNGVEEILKLFNDGRLFKDDKDDDFSDLMRAAICGDVKEVKELLEAGVDVNEEDEVGRTALEFTLDPDNFLDEEEKVEIAKLLIQAGADVKKKYHNSSIFLKALKEVEESKKSINCDKTDQIKALKKADCYGDKQEEGMTSLMCAAKAGDVEIVEALLKAGYYVNAKDYYGWTALSYALKEGHQEVVKLLKEAGADVGEVLEEKAPTDVKQTKEASVTALLWASSEGYVEVVKALIQVGVDVNVANEDGETALMLADKYGHQEVVKLLREAGAVDEQDEVDEEMVASVMKAAIAGDVETVKKLLAARADVNAKDKDGDTPLKLASKEGHKEVVKLMEESDEEDDNDKIVKKALTNSASAKALGKAIVSAIVEYYVDGEGEEPEYSPDWFEGWTLCEGLDDTYSKCGIDYDDIRENVVERFMEILEEDESLEDYGDKIQDRIMEDADEMLRSNYHVIEMTGWKYLVKARKEVVKLMEEFDEEDDNDKIVKKALTNSASAKALGKAIVSAIVEYYVDGEGEEPEYSPDWFEGWTLCEGLDDTYSKCGIDYDDIRENVVERFMEILEEDESLEDYGDKIQDRIMEDADEMLRGNYHVIELAGWKYLVKARDF